MISFDMLLTLIEVKISVSNTRINRHVSIIRYIARLKFTKCTRAI